MILDWVWHPGTSVGIDHFTAHHLLNNLKSTGNLFGGGLKYVLGIVGINHYKPDSLST